MSVAVVERFCGCGCGAPVRSRYLRGHNPLIVQRANSLVASSLYQREAGAGKIITPMIIAYVQAWLRLRLGVEAGLVIERCAERNRVALRFREGPSTYEAEVARLNALRREYPKAHPDRITALFERTA
jgi:hypothetical protein